MDKAAIRLQMTAQRAAMSSSQARKLSSEICTKVLSLPAVMGTQSIGIYLPFRSEVLVDGLFAPLSENGKKIFAPVVSGKDDIRFALLGSLRDTGPGYQGIQEPKTKNFAQDGSIGVFVIPGIAFDLHGFRVGWGSGHYDRLLSRNPYAVKIGVSYDFQIVERIDAEPHDVKMDFIVTEKRVLEL